MSQRADVRRVLPGILIGLISGAVAMFLLSALAAASLILALAASLAVAGAGGALAAPRLRRGTAGGNLAGLSTLAGVLLLALPLLLSGTGALAGSQVILFGLALAAVSSMVGHLTNTG